ncbi:Hypothetical predicted protein [Olea europaea subsp. europaea]|uniref:Uncharacterized protein n=1 Tax=Olea europaea subsp. europaea TaxID=158383 RepID=A0A8S0PPW2_OLEEU|nr:Hypothetical predicted protein [Olea europaea subsp. europaea]
MSSTTPSVIPNSQELAESLEILTVRDENDAGDGDAARLERSSNFSTLPEVSSVGGKRWVGREVLIWAKWG